MQTRAEDKLVWTMPSVAEFGRSQFSCKREHEQTHLFIAEKLSKRELEQTHLFIAECSLLWIKSVQPALDKISAAEFGRSQTCNLNLGKAKPDTSINYSAFLFLNY